MLIAESRTKPVVTSASCFPLTEATSGAKYRKSLFDSIYLEHQWVDATGQGLSADFNNTLEKFGFDLTFIKKNLAGIATDGQYIKLGVEKHL